MLRTKAGLRAGLTTMLVTSALAGCAPEMKMVPTASPGVGVRFSRGEAVMLSAGEQGAIAVLPRRYNGNSRQVMFVVAAYDRAGMPFNFGPENVTITLDTGAALDVHDFDTVRHGAIVEAQRSEALSALLGAIDLYSASRAGRHDPARGLAMAQEAADRYEGRSASIAERLERRVDEASNVLQTTTIDPSTLWGGWIVADQPPLAAGEVRRMTVNVELGGEVHHFALYLAPEGTPTPREANLPAVTRGDGQKLLYETPPTWLWDVPPAPPKPVDTIWSVSRF